VVAVRVLATTVAEEVAVEEVLVAVA